MLINSGRLSLEVGGTISPWVHVVVPIYGWTWDLPFSMVCISTETLLGRMDLPLQAIIYWASFWVLDGCLCLLPLSVRDPIWLRAAHAAPVSVSSYCSSLVSRKLSSLVSPIAIGSYRLSTWAPWARREGLMETTRSGPSVPRSLTLCPAVGFCVYFHVLQEEASLLMPEQDWSLR